MSTTGGVPIKGQGPDMGHFPAGTETARTPSKMPLAPEKQSAPLGPPRPKPAPQATSQVSSRRGREQQSLEPPLVRLKAPPPLLSPRLKGDKIKDY